MALTCKALLVGQDAGHQAADGVRHGHGRNLPSRQHEIAQRQFLVHARLQKTLVHTLVVAADQHQVVVIPHEALGRLLCKGFSLRREIDHPGFFVLSG
jgi:hypothetical protein